MRLDGLTNLMDELSKQTWFNLATARQLGMRMGEVTITEMNLLAIARLVQRKGLNVEMIATRSDEKTTGTDFEIWVKLRSGRLIGFAVQAKVVYIHNGRYEYRSLGHRNANGGQIDLLEAHAMRRGAHPVHVFFNGWDVSDVKAPQTPRGRLAEFYGCSAVMTSVVKRVRKGMGSRGGVNRVAPYLNVSVPWSELFLIPDRPISSDGVAGGAFGDSSSGWSGSRRSDPDGDGVRALRPIEATDKDFDALEARLSALGGEGTAIRRTTELPTYITRHRGLSRSQVVDDEENHDAPPYALLIEED